LTVNPVVTDGIGMIKSSPCNVHGTRQVEDVFGPDTRN